MSFSFGINPNDKSSVDPSWERFGIMGCLLESTKNNDRVFRHGAQLLWEIQEGATMKEIQQRIINLLLSKKVWQNELFIFHEDSEQFQSDFDRAYRVFRRSLITGRLALENNL